MTMLRFIGVGKPVSWNGLKRRQVRQIAQRAATLIGFDLKKEWSIDMSQFSSGLEDIRSICLSKEFISETQTTETLPNGEVMSKALTE